MAGDKFKNKFAKTIVGLINHRRALQTLPFGPHPHLFRSWLSQTLPSSSHKHKTISANKHTTHRSSPKRSTAPKRRQTQLCAASSYSPLFSAYPSVTDGAAPWAAQTHTLGIVLLTPTSRRRSPPAHLTFTSFGALNLRDIPSCESMRARPRRQNYV